MLKKFNSHAFTANPKTSLKDVSSYLTKSPKNYSKLCVIIDDKNRLLGVLNYADLLKHASHAEDLNAPAGDIMQKDPVLVKDSFSSTEILHTVRESLKSRGVNHKKLISIIPVIDEDKRLVDVIDISSNTNSLNFDYQNVLVYGMGFVGLTLSVALSSVGYKVTGIDRNFSIIKSLKKGIPHIHEPNLKEILTSQIKEKNLIFDTKVNEEFYSTFIVAVGTPVNSSGEVMLDSLIEVCKEISQQIYKNDLIILRSTVPAGTTRDKILPILEKGSHLKAGQDFHLAFCPERTIEGDAIAELSNLPQIIGGYSKSCVERASLFWSKLASNIVIVDSLEAAELIKLVNNSFRDLSFSFSNGLASLASSYNLDARKIILAANEGYPRDNIPMPSPGVGGYCLTKDPFLYASGDSKSLAATLSETGRKINIEATEHPVKHVENFALRNHLKYPEIKVFILGLAFKGSPETNDLRGSSSLEVFHKLEILGCEVYGYDAVALKEEVEFYGVPYRKPEELEGNINVLLIMNNHKSHTLSLILPFIKGQKILIFDGWGQIDQKVVESFSNATYASLGYMTPLK